ncbi:MAG: hypothetical protein JW706_12200, partial [Opitutales bacterium]|nr:hypothetical protein [Opitutales bacterium]
NGVSRQVQCLSSHRSGIAAVKAIRRILRLTGSQRIQVNVSRDKSQCLRQGFRHPTFKAIHGECSVVPLLVVIPDRDALQVLAQAPTAQ